MKEEDYNYLKGFEHNFSTIINADWMTAIPVRDVNKIYDIYKELIPDGQLSLNPNCSKCVGNLMRAVGKLYFKEKEKEPEEKPKSKNRKIKLQ